MTGMWYGVSDRPLRLADGSALQSGILLKKFLFAFRTDGRKNQRTAPELVMRNPEMVHGQEAVFLL